MIFQGTAQQDFTPAKNRLMGSMIRTALLSAAALVVVGAGTGTAVGATLQPGQVSYNPLADIEPQSGQPAPQILSGSDLPPPQTLSAEQVPTPPSLPPAEQPMNNQVVEMQTPPPTPDDSALASPASEPVAEPAPQPATAPRSLSYMPPPPPQETVVEAAPPVSVQAPEPESAVVTAAPTAPTLPPPNEAISGQSATTKLMPEPNVDRVENYYDSRLNVPTGPLSETVGPRKVDPVLEPASKFVVSRRNADAGDVEAQVVAANRALDLGRYESALEMFDALYKNNNRDTRILMGRAVAQQKLGMDDVAILSYEALLDLVPNNTDAVVNMMGLIRKQYPSVALRRLSDLREKFPANAGIAAQLGMAYADLGQNQEALRSLGTASSLEPNNAQHLYNMAVVSDRAGSKNLAIQYYEQALQTDAVYGGGRSVPREKIYDRLSKLRS